MAGANCPQCGGAVSFEKAALPVAVCPSCRSLLQYQGAELTRIGENGQLPFDVSPLQIGTTLMLRGERGEVVGRARWGWAEGSWNEWFVYMPDGTTRWVAEESGLFMVMEEIELGPWEKGKLNEIDRADRAALGAKFEHDGVNYTVADIKTVRCISSEGNLAEPIGTGTTIESIDMRTSDGRAFTYQSGDGDEAFLGYYAELHQLDPQNLRSFESWPPPDYVA